MNVCGRSVTLPLFMASVLIGAALNVAAQNSNGGLASAVASSPYAVTISSPADNLSLTSPVHLVASYNGTPKYMKVWIDHVPGPGIHNTATVDQMLALASGTHLIEVQGHENGKTYTSAVNVTVSASVNGSGALASDVGGITEYPTPPANAVVFEDAQTLPNTGVCSGSNCSGGSGLGTAWIARYQNQPSLSSSSTELYNEGDGFDTLWYWHLGAQDQATNLEFQFSLMVDDNSLVEGQAFENGPQQYIDGYKYSMTIQCEYPKQMWRVWDQAGRGWKSTSVACPQWTPNVWHTVQMYITTDHVNHTETYHSLVVDGQLYPLEMTIGVTNVGFESNLGFQFQIDNKNGSTGPGVHEWIDNVSLTVW
jgi:hypothetical protein